MSILEKQPSDTPLVSVCIITYNSSRTIVETLDSVLSQTYPHIELIVSDDCSSDNTVSLCDQWINANRNRFFRTQLIIHEQNGGLAKNINSAISQAAGEWLKPLAGDDILLSDCIRDNMDFACHHDNDGVLFSKIQLFFTNDDNERVMMDSSMPHPAEIKYFSKTAKEQYHHLLSCCFAPAVSVFYKRSVIIDFPYAEEYPFCEDWPMWIRLTQAGKRLSYLNKLTVLYRVHSRSLSHSSKEVFVNQKYHLSQRDVFLKECYLPLRNIDPELAEQTRKEFVLGDVAVDAFKNRQTFLSRTVLYILKKMMHIDIAR